MKKIILFGIALLSINLTACNKDALSPIDSQTLAATENVTADGLRGQAPGDSTHKRPPLTEIDIAALPAIIADYITKTYAGSTIKKTGKDEKVIFTY